MFVAPGTIPDLGYKLTREAAVKISRNWFLLLLNGLLLIIAGVLVFSIDWTIRSLATFLGALFVVQGVAAALTQGIDSNANRTNLLTGLLSVATGIAIIAWPSPGIVAIAIVLGSWLIVFGGLNITGGFAARSVLPDWWMIVLLGVLEIPLGVLALANPGATLASLITVAGIFGVAIGITRIALAFSVKNLPKQVDEAWSRPAGATNGKDSRSKTSTVRAGHA